LRSATSTLWHRRILFVTIAAVVAAGLAGAVAVERQAPARAAGQDVARFKLVANPKFANCIARFPGDAQRAPAADVIVTRGQLNDTLTLNVHNIKPNLAFDLFTVQRTPFKADGSPDPAFKGSFGLAWYQSDVQANLSGEGAVQVRTILLDQIFGFDPDANLAPTNTFHVGFWFNNPNDAAACGFDPAKPTPFNGEHKAGPLAMISLPNAVTGLGPLCINPDTSVTPARCNP
jgi:hypothetical protein